MHSFPSIAEIQEAGTEEEKTKLYKRNLEESRDFDTALRAALGERVAGERNKRLLELENLREFKRSHPTVEHLTPMYVASGAAGDAGLKVLGVDVVVPGMSYLNIRFDSETIL